MKRNICFLVIISFTQAFSSENIVREYLVNSEINNIKGIVLDKKTNEPVQFAHAFVNQTTCGTYTTIDGSFELDCNIDLSKLELFISHVGYEDIIVKVDQNWNGIKTLYMVPSARELVEVTVLSKKAKKNRDKNLKTFQSEFLGKNKAGKKCFIENLEVVYFKDSLDALWAFSDEPIKVSNFFTGYKTDFYLKSFVFNKKTTLPKYSGYYFMQEIDTSNFILRKKWKAERETSYEGSLTHFFNSLVSNSLKADGYILLNKKTLKIAITDFQGGKKVSVSEDLNIQFTREIEPNSYRVWVSQVVDKKFDPRGTKVQSEGSRYQTTSISPIYQQVIINENGQIANQENIILNGYMGWERVADLLPFDYKNE